MEGYANIQNTTTQEDHFAPPGRQCDIVLTPRGFISQSVGVVSYHSVMQITLIDLAYFLTCF